MELVEFLLARIAEDERRARAANDRIPLIYNEAALRDKGIGIAQAGHIARWDPARVLAECAAKRRIVELYSRVDFSESGHVLGGDGPEVYWEVLRLLALPYRSHSDYDPAWNPEATQ